MAVVRRGGRDVIIQTHAKGFYSMFQRFFDEGLAQSSYVIACDRTREAAVVDPRRDIDVYVAAAQQRGLTIRYAIDTHVHADFVSGSRELAQLGARVISGPGAGLRFEHDEMRDGQRLQLGDATLTMLYTPGHTPEHISILVEHPGECPCVLTGDTLFVGAVGRPDLLGHDQARKLAEQLFESLAHTLLALGDEVEVYPGHGAGSLCGSGIAGEPHSTIGRERMFNPMLQHRSKAAFVDAVLGDLPEMPPYFRRMKTLNHEGPPVLGLSKGVPPPRAMAAQSVAAGAADGALLIDLRDAAQFAEAHPFGPKLAYWAGWVIPAEARLILVAENERQALEARRQMLRVGLDGVEGHLSGTFEAWRAAGLPISQIEFASMPELLERLARRESLILVDVRTRREFESGHIPGAVHVPVDDVVSRAAELGSAACVATICEGGYRSSLAASLLARSGAQRVMNVKGGMAAYRAARAHDRGTGA
jgi:hydroxyacylglutathione hydrolase